MLDLVKEKEQIRIDRKEEFIEDETKNDNFVQVYRNKIYALRQLYDNPIAGKIFHFIMEHMDKANALVCSSKVIEEFLNIHRTTVSRNIKHLVDNGYITKLKSGNTNVFVLNNKIAWTSKANHKGYCKFDNSNILVSKSEQEKNTKKIEKSFNKKLMIKE